MLIFNDLLMAWLLFLDTTAANSSIYLANEAGKVYSFYANDAKSQAAIMNVAINQLLQEANISMHALSGVVVNAGPGSYTGLRIALSCAKGVCYALDIPLLAHNKLQLLAQSALAGQHFTTALIALKARTDEYFVAGYNQLFETILAPVHLHAGELAALTSYDTFISIGDNSLWQDKAMHMDMEVQVDPTIWIKAGFDSFNNKQFEDIAYFEPMYLKAVYTTVSRKKM